MSDAQIARISGALVEARPLSGVSLYELVQVGEQRLMGEVIRVEGERSTIQVYQDTTGLKLGEPVHPTGEPLTIELGPGLLGAVVDGVGRPLARLAEQTGNFLAPGTAAPTLERKTQWAFEPAVAPGDVVEGGDVLGSVSEKPGLAHLVMVPPGGAGRVEAIEGGRFSIEQPVGRLADGTPLALAHRWPVRQPRPVAGRLPIDRPFVTRQRVLDFLFPVAEGGSVSVPGGFGTGKTVIEQSLAKYADADVVLYVGCGERGNEMAEVLTEFPGLVEAATGRTVMDRTILVVNTSNMPVAAREASVFVGATIAEYYRDMGYRVAVMADSLSRWAEALREMSARLREMPGEEGYPTYLGNRLAKWYERAGRVRALGKPERSGAVTIVSAVSPPGGDFSEPVTQASLRVTGALWALDAGLANQRQFPAVDWETSYSLYEGQTSSWFAENVAADWPELRREMLSLLGRDRELREIAGLVGHEALQDQDRLLLEAARVIREVVLGQDAYAPHDAASTAEKTHRLALLARQFFRTAQEGLEAGVALEHLDLSVLRQRLVTLRHVPDEEFPLRASEVETAISSLAAIEREQRRKASDEPQPGDGGGDEEPEAVMETP